MKEITCRVPEIWPSAKSVFALGKEWLALSKECLCRVPEIWPSAKSQALGKARVSSSDGDLILQRKVTSVWDYMRHTSASSMQSHPFVCQIHRCDKITRWSMSRCAWTTSPRHEALDPLGVHEAQVWHQYA